MFIFLAIRAGHIFLSRIKYCTQEIVVFRQDLMDIMKRNSILPVNDTEIPLECHVI